MTKANITAMRLPVSNAVGKHFADDFRKLCFDIDPDRTRRTFESVEVILQLLIHQIQNHLGRFMFGIEREHLMYELPSCHIFEFFVAVFVFCLVYNILCVITIRRQSSRCVIIGRHQLDIRLDENGYRSLVRSACCAADRMSSTSSGEGREGRGCPCPAPATVFPSVFIRPSFLMTVL